jgi:hypothetical protein
MRCQPDGHVPVPSLEVTPGPEIRRGHGSFAFPEGKELLERYSKNAHPLEIPRSWLHGRLSRIRSWAIGSLATSNAISLPNQAPKLLPCMMALPTGLFHLRCH